MAEALGDIPATSSGPLPVVPPPVVPTPVVLPAVVITGIAMCTSLGADAETTWRAVLAGDVGIGPLPAVESALPAESVGGQALEPPAEYRPDLSREARMLRWTVEHALRDAGLNSARAPRPSPRRTAAIFGTTLHGMRAGGRYLRTQDISHLREFLAGATAARAIAGLGIEGSVATTCSACSSSLGAITLGVTLLESGAADMVVAGGYDAISEYSWAGFQALRLITPTDLRPFCTGRQGMKVGEGYGVIILERAGDAATRGARVLARLAGWGESADAHHLTKPHPQGAGALCAMRTALARAGLTAPDISLITAHATGTPDNDAGESAALAGLLGTHLHAVPVVAHKSRLAHTLGGAGAIELILSVLAIRDQMRPTTANVALADIEYPGLNVSVGAPAPADIRRTLNTSLGFGGANTCVVLTSPAAASANVPIDVQPKTTPCITGMGVLLPGIVGWQQLSTYLRQKPGLALPAAISDSTLAQFTTARRARRMSPSVKFALAAAELALADAQLAADSERLASASCMVGSMHGSVGFCAEYYSQIVREGPLAANPVLFAEGVPNAAAAHLSTAFNIRGACQVIMGSRTAGLDALALAAARVQTGAAQLVLVVAMEEPSALVDSVYSALDLRDEKGVAGFRTSHGAVAFVVESAHSAAARGAAAWTAIGAANSAFLGSAGVPRAVSRVMSTLGPCERVIGSASGTWLGRAEAAGLRYRRRSASQSPSAADVFGEAFALTPFVGIARALLTGESAGPGPGAGAGGGVGVRVAESFTSLCSDWEGSVTGVRFVPPAALLAPRCAPRSEGS